MEPTTVQIVAGCVAIAMLMVIWLAPAIRVNLPRRLRRRAPLPWRDIRASDLGSAALRQLTEPQLAEDRALRRQKSWEKHLYYREIRKGGHAWSRGWCAEHQRYCRSTGGPHEPGGDNPPVPEDFEATIEGVPRRPRGQDRP
jgi:hypothetical protein